jgi:hypothetical protein
MRRYDRYTQEFGRRLAEASGRRGRSSARPPSTRATGAAAWSTSSPTTSIPTSGRATLRTGGYAKTLTFTLSTTSP